MIVCSNSDKCEEVDKINISDLSHKVFLYGAGEMGREWLASLNKDTVQGFIDSDELKIGTYKYGKRIYSLDEIKKLGENVKIFISANSENKREILKTLEIYGLKNNVVGSPVIDYAIKKGAHIDSCSKLMGKNYIGEESVLENVEIGYGSYIARNTKLSETKIGKYSSIGPAVSIIIGQHPTGKFVSTSPFFYSSNNEVGMSYVNETIFDEYRYTRNGYRIEIGNDVWIGANVTLMEGITIADGTIIAAGANVVKDTEPYAIVGGNPAKVIRYRFDQDDIKFLQELRWWDKTEEWIIENVNYFSDIKLLRERY